MTSQRDIDTLNNSGDDQSIAMKIFTESKESMKINKFFAALFLSVSLLLSSTGLTSPALASPPPPLPLTASPESSCSSKGEPVQLASVQDQRSISDWKSRARSDIRTTKVKLHAAQDLLAFDDLKVTLATKKGQTSTVVSIPLSSPELSALSFLSIVYFNGQIDNYNETQISRNTLGNFQFKVFTNGSLTKDVDSGLPWMSPEELRSGPSTPELTEGPQLQGLAEKALCVAAVLAISYRAALFIVGICGSACSTFGTNPVSAGVCGACVTGIVAAAGGAITGVIACFHL